MSRDDDAGRQRAENARLQAENAALRSALATAQETIRAQQEALARLEARVAELEQRPPPWAKAKTPERAATARRKRAPEHNKGRRREEPTQIVEHAYERCPACAYALRGQSVAWSRQVIELPAPAPVAIIEHRGFKRYCPVCQKWQTPRVALSGQVLGQGRLGVRLVSLLGWLRARLRLPLGQIQELLHPLYGLHLSEGGIVDCLRRLAQATRDERGRIAAHIRAAPAVHADETSWRENGQHGWVWVQTTADGACLYTYDRSRSGEVAQALLDACTGVRCTDFSAAYNGVLGRKQRCWAHLLRALRTLKTAQPQDAAVQDWAQALHALYERSQECLRLDLSPAQRQRAYRQLADRARALARCYADTADHPCQVLAQRLRRHRGELFEFVRVPQAGATNNDAERVLRPLVIGRKISGGTRSPQGTTTRLDLASVFQTWHARSANSFAACFSLLHSGLPQL
jgi:transposase